MQSQTALERQSETSSNRPFFVEAKKLLDRMQELSESIGRRAYEFFEARGGEIGHALDDWLQAEAELLLPVSVEVNATDKQFFARIEAPGFKADEIKVSLEPNRPTISGESANKAKQKTEQVVYRNDARGNSVAQSNCPSKLIPDAGPPHSKTACLNARWTRPVWRRQ